MPVSVKCLVVGMSARAFPSEDYLSGAVRAIEPSALPACRHLLQTLELVVAPLFGQDYDALEIMEQLAAQGYRGTLRVIAPPLPNRQIVLRELRSHAARQGILIEMVEKAARPS